jgi:serine/threonine protein phosphatase PrpC
MLARGAVTAEEAKHWPQNVITKAVGIHDNPELEVVTGAFAEHDVFVLCSDGLTKHVSDDEIRQLACTQDAQASSAALVDLAVERGGLDNVTVVVVRPIRKESSRERTVTLASEDAPDTNIWE